MDLGIKIKRSRILCQLTQEELANRCELTKGYISQLENNLVSPSISTLQDILNALGLTLKEFFSDEGEDEKFVFTTDDYIVNETEEQTMTWLVPNAQKNEMEPVMVEIKPNCSTYQDFPHEGQEFGYVLEGEVKVVVGSNSHVCKKGETFYFTTDKTHYLVNETQEYVKVIWVSSPPNF